MTAPDAPTSVTTVRLTERWPTALGLVSAAGAAVVIAGIDDVGDAFAPGAAAMMALYVATYAIGKPLAVWLVFPVSVAVVILLDAFLGVQGAVGWTAVLGLSWLGMLAPGRTSDSPWFTLETMGLVFFGGLTITAALADARLAGVLAGVGWFTHGLWDAYHFARNRVVHRTWSELCAVVDIPVGTLLIVVSITR